MPLAVVYEKRGLHVTYDDDRRVLFVGLPACPPNDEIDHMWTIVAVFLQNLPRRCSLHLAHVDTPTMEPPSMQTLVHVVSLIATHFEILKKCKRVVVQPRCVDEKVRAAQAMFGMFNNTINLTVEADPAKVEAALKGGGNASPPSRH